MFFSNPSIPKWDKLPKEKREEFARDMEVYAAMLDYMDMSIGRIFDYLKKEGKYDNTMIIFMSDNGANGAMATSYPGNADGKYLSTFDNSMKNKGLKGSFVEMEDLLGQKLHLHLLDSLKDLLLKEESKHL